MEAEISDMYGMNDGQLMDQVVDSPVLVGPCVLGNSTPSIKRQWSMSNSNTSKTEVAIF